MIEEFLQFSVIIVMICGLFKLYSNVVHLKTCQSFYLKMVKVTHNTELLRFSLALCNIITDVNLQCVTDFLEY